MFVHGWLPKIELVNNTFRYDDWRTAVYPQWYDAVWTNGFDAWDEMHRMEKEQNRIFEEKTVVCGHWHTSYAHTKYHHLGMEFPVEDSDIDDCHFEPFVDDRIIGMDACTAFSGLINVAVIDDEPFVQQSEED